MSDRLSNEDLARCARGDVWAREFMKALEANPGIEIDQAWMENWFSNSIMAGYDEAEQRFRAEKDAAYTKCSHCMIFMTRMGLILGLRAGRWYSEGKGWMVSVRIPTTGWIDWCVSESQLDAFEDLPLIEKEQEDDSASVEYQRTMKTRLGDANQN